MSTAKPTKAQRNALVLLADGHAYRSTRAFASADVHAPDGRITAATTTVLVRNGWATWGTEVGLRKPLLLTDSGRSHLPADQK
ncbi:hypothetical protein [Streptomyces parvulus]|uniref:hypothetical protein n=1 Tax=Streptomyces parvulus TaxID=146923 RepID=UPI001CFB9CB5|nr:hypothetical protein [Streptomyces parvulus]